jgi:hypothetical protein
MWASDLADDSAPHPEAAAALRDLAGLVRDGGRQVTAVLDKARAFLPPPEGSPPRRVLEWMADGLYDLVAESWQPLARQAAEDERPALTRAQVSALDIVARRQPLRAAGLLLRLLKTADDPAARACTATWTTSSPPGARTSRRPSACAGSPSTTRSPTRPARYWRQPRPPWGNRTGRTVDDLAARPSPSRHG